MSCGHEARVDRSSTTVEINIFYILNTKSDGSHIYISHGGGAQCFMTLKIGFSLLPVISGGKSVNSTCSE